MSAAAILTLIGIVNGIITFSNSAPGIVEHAKAILAVVEPHVAAAGDDVKKAFVEAQARVSSL